MPVGEGDSLVKTDVEERKCREQTGLETLVVYTVNTECCDLMVSFLFFLFKKNLKKNYFGSLS
jgi:hypothetical protein